MYAFAKDHCSAKTTAPLFTKVTSLASENPVVCGKYKKPTSREYFGKYSAIHARTFFWKWKCFERFSKKLYLYNHCSNFHKFDLISFRELYSLRKLPTKMHLSKILKNTAKSAQEYFLELDMIKPIFKHFYLQNHCSNFHKIGVFSFSEPCSLRKVQKKTTSSKYFGKYSGICTRTFFVSWNVLTDFQKYLTPKPLLQFSQN